MKQFVDGPQLDDAPLFDEHDAIGSTDAAEPVRNDDAGALGRVAAQRRRDRRFVLSVERARGLVYEQDWGRLHQCPSDRDALALASRERTACLADPAVPAIGQIRDDRVHPGEGSRS